MKYKNIPTEHKSSHRVDRNPAGVGSHNERSDQIDASNSAQSGYHHTETGCHATKKYIAESEEKSLK